ncbi:hypothetical protein LTS08_007252 [Lithohypha guttulata]|nr:hypothetical protein LTS08_007252 [Lithohypha guttulata]
MISISHKQPTLRTATAISTLLFSHPETLPALTAANNRKGDAIAVARIAAIQAAKQTPNLIPLAHPSLSITGITVDIEAFDGEERWIEYRTRTKGSESEEVGELIANHGGVTVTATVSCDGKTGVEMEAITSATMGTITLYDMLKGVDKGMVIMGCRVVRKSGGKSGGWRWNEREQRLVKDGEEVRARQTRPGVAVSQMAPSTPGSMLNETPLSEIDEWNEGLTSEFLLPDLDEIVAEVEELERGAQPSAARSARDDGLEL